MPRLTEKEPGGAGAGYCAAQEPVVADQPSPFQAAMAYWSRLDAPLDEIARALRLDAATVAKAIESGSIGQFGSITGWPSASSWQRRTVAHLIRDGLNRSASTPFMHVSGMGSLTLGEVRAAIARVAAGLRQAGLGLGDRVAVDATQRLESYLVCAAALLSGVVVVRLSLAGGPVGVRAMLGAASVQLTFSEFAETAGLDTLSAAGQTIVLSTADADDMDPRGFASWLDRCPDTDDLAAAAVNPGDPALIGFTSGSTGQPKLVETSHLAVFRSSEAMQTMFGFDAQDVFCTSTDFSALSALRSMLTMPLLSGGQVVLPTALARTQPLALGLECAQFGVTRLTAIPNVLRGLASAHDRLPALPRLRMMLSGSGVLDRATHDLVATEFGIRVIDYFGAREFGTVVYSRADGQGTVSDGGGQICNALIRIINDQGEVMPDGATGEIMVHTDAMTTGPLAGSHPGWEGWHQTGDLGRIKPSGDLEVTGRRRDVIKAADGSLVFPVEIEALLNAMPGVCESCVLGWPGQSGRDHIIAAVVLDRPEDDGFAVRARAHVLQAAGRFRVPAAVLTVPGFDRVGNGKIDKAALRERLQLRVGDLP